MNPKQANSNRISLALMAVTVCFGAGSAYTTLNSGNAFVRSSKLQPVGHFAAQDSMRTPVVVLPDVKPGSPAALAGKLPTSEARSKEFFEQASAASPASVAAAATRLTDGASGPGSAGGTPAASAANASNAPIAASAALVNGKTGLGPVHATAPFPGSSADSQQPKSVKGEYAKSGKAPGAAKPAVSPAASKNTEVNAGPAAASVEPQSTKPKAIIAEPLIKTPFTPLVMTSTEDKVWVRTDEQRTQIFNKGQHVPGLGTFKGLEGDKPAFSQP